MLSRLAAVAAFAWAGTGGALAQTSIPLVNPGFEADHAPAGGFPVLLPSGWSLYDPGGIVDQGNNAVGVVNPTGSTFFIDPVPEGSNAALIYLEQRAGTTAIGDPVGLQQSFATVLQAHTRYTLSASVGNIASGTGLGAFSGLGFYDLSGFPGYRLELLAGGQVIAVDDNSLAGTLGEGRFATATVQFTAGADHALLGSVLGVRVVNLNATGNTFERGREVDFDQIQLFAAAVPEPRDYAMWLAGLGLLYGLRRKRRQVPVSGVAAH